MPLGDFISAVGSYFGGKSNQRANARVNSMNLAHADRWNQKSLDFSNRQFTEGIQTRVADAKKAGIHPLYALGSPGAGSPSFSVGGASSSGALGQGISAAGAAVGRAFSKRDPLARELHEANLANVHAQTAKTNAEALYWESQARKPVSGAGLGVNGERGQRAGELAAEAAAIRAAIGTRRARSARRSVARGSSATARGGRGRRERSSRDSIDVLRSPLGPIPVSAATPSVDEAEKYIGDWADWSVGIPNYFNIYGSAWKRHLKKIYGSGWRQMVGPATERQRTLRWQRRRRNAR